MSREGASLRTLAGGCTVRVRAASTYGTRTDTVRVAAAPTGNITVLVLVPRLMMLLPARQTREYAAMASPGLLIMMDAAHELGLPSRDHQAAAGGDHHHQRSTIITNHDAITAHILIIRQRSGQRAVWVWLNKASNK